MTSAKINAAQTRANEILYKAVIEPLQDTKTVLKPASNKMGKLLGPRNTVVIKPVVKALKVVAKVVGLDASVTIGWGANWVKKSWIGKK